MFDPDTIRPIPLDELVICEGDDITECDRLHCNDTIGPCAACPVKRGNTPAPDDEAA